MSKRAKPLKRLLASRRLGAPTSYSLDRLEERQLMSVVTWTGNGLTSNWSEGANWSTNAPPNAGDTLVFAADSNNFTPVDDLPSGFTVGTLDITGGSYQISGNNFTLLDTLSVSSDMSNEIDNAISTYANANITISVGGTNLDLEGVLTMGDGGVIGISAAGSLALDGSSPATTAVMAVSFGLVNAEGNYGNAFEIAPDAQFINGGTVGRVLNERGTFTVPGFNAEVTGDLTQGPSSVLVTNYEGSGFNSLLTVDGTVTLQGTLQVTLYYTPAPGEVLTVINNAGPNVVAGTFDNLPEGSTLNINGNNYTLSYQGGDGNDVILTRQGSTPTTTNVTITNRTITFGQVASFSATVTSTLGTPTGTVTFMDGSTSLGTETIDGDGFATFSTSLLLAGTHNITAIYSGDSNDAGNTSSVATQIVSHAAATTTLTSSASIVPQNAPVTFTATVIGVFNVGAEPQGGRPLPLSPTGTVSFYDGPTFLGSSTLTTNVSALPEGDTLRRNSTATFTTSSLPPGPHLIIAIYNGDTNYSFSTPTANNVTVGDVTPPVLTTALTDVQSPGAAKYIFTLTFTDANGVDVLPLISNPTVSVTGPGHFAQMAKFLGVTTTAAGLRTVTFRITPPGGSWDADDAGTYTVHMAANSVKDGQGNWLAAAPAGTFYMSPTPFFDERYYLAHNPGVADAVNAGIQSSGYAHFLGWGQFEGRDPSAVYNEKRYLSLNPDVAKQVKAGMYKSGFDQLTKIGISQKRQVTAFFNETYYLAANPDVAAQVKAGTYRSGLEQYLLAGQFQSRNPSVDFIDSYYRTQNPSVVTQVQAGAYESAFEQFLEAGQQAGLSANTFFNEQFYLTNYPGVAAAVTARQFSSGLEHYILYGAAAGYLPNASAQPTHH